ncbi:hypothetical protein ACM43_16375 [Bradyrhizobium sp. CCBAU 45321]|nr:hypothetical protein [Bradyrhizobium sp. CCBAU 45321]MDA9545966.1 hypothetical protein [Bradyrhizobium sp. CCBAU 45321]
MPGANLPGPLPDWVFGTLTGSRAAGRYAQPAFHPSRAARRSAAQIGSPTAADALGCIYAGWPAAASYPACRSPASALRVQLVSLLRAALMMPMSLVTLPLGVKAADAMSKRTLEMAFGCYLLIVGSRFVLSLLGWL